MPRVLTVWGVRLFLRSRPTQRVL